MNSGAEKGHEVFAGGEKKRMWNGDNKTARKIDEGELGEGGRGNSRDDEVAPKQKVVMN